MLLFCANANIVSATRYALVKLLDSIGLTPLMWLVWYLIDTLNGPLYLQVIMQLCPSRPPTTLGSNSPGLIELLQVAVLLALMLVQ